MSVATAEVTTKQLVTRTLHVIMLFIGNTPGSLIMMLKKGMVYQGV